MLAFIVAILAALLAAAATAAGFLSVDAGAFLTFILVLSALILKDKHKVKREGIVLIRRTMRGREFIDRMQKKHTAMWSKAAKLGVVIGIIFLVIGTFFLINQAVKILNGSEEGGVRLLLPGPVSDPVAAPGVFFFPWWIWVIGIAVVIIPHEFMHGIMCRLEGIRIKSVGWILLLVIPGAFVEPDEKQLQKAKRSTKMKVYAAGSFANIVIAFVILVIFASIFSVAFAPSGLAVATVDGSPANLSGLHGAITEIDGRPVRNSAELAEVLSLYEPGDAVEVRTVDAGRITPKFGFDFSPKPVAISEGNENIYAVTLADKNNTGKAFLGVVPQMETYSTSLPVQAYSSIAYIFLWIYVFSLGIGVVNLLPLKPLDGGLLFEEIVGRFTKRQKNIARFVSTAVLLLLVFNLVGPLLL